VLTADKDCDCISDLDVSSTAIQSHDLINLSELNHVIVNVSHGEITKVCRDIHPRMVKVT
jgi:hypothetical protein